MLTHVSTNEITMGFCNIKQDKIIVYNKARQVYIVYNRFSKYGLLFKSTGNIVTNTPHAMINIKTGIIYTIKDNHN